MKTKLLIICLLAAGFLMTTVVDAQAGDKKRRGSSGSEQLLIPVTARTVGLGASFTSGLAGASGLEGIFANPAALTVNTGTNALFSRMNYVADIGVNHFGVAQALGANNIALSVTSWSFGDIPVQTETAPEMTDVTWTAAYNTVAATYARQFTDRIAAGVTFKYVSERIDDMNSNGLAFDAGMTYVVGETGLRFGVSLKNFGPERAFSGTGLKRSSTLQSEGQNGMDATVSLDGAGYELPSLLNFGAAYTRDITAGTSLTVMGNFRSNSFASDQYSAGAELGLRNILFLRGGYQLQEDMNSTFYSGLNFGAGLNLDVAGTNLAIDYAYRATELFNNVQVLTASVSL